MNAKDTADFKRKQYNFIFTLADVIIDKELKLYAEASGAFNDNFERAQMDFEEEEKCEDLTITEILYYWRSYQHSMHFLAGLTRRLLSVPVISAPQSKQSRLKAMLSATKNVPWLQNSKSTSVSSR